MRFLKLWWQIALEWLHDVAWALCCPIDQVRQFSAEKVIPYLRQKNNY